jgi:hypothetical protein
VKAERGLHIAVSWYKRGIDFGKEMSRDPLLRKEFAARFTSQTPESATVALEVPRFTQLTKGYEAVPLYLSSAMLRAQSAHNRSSSRPEELAVS